MKKSILVFLISITLSLLVLADEKEVIQKAREFFYQGKLTEALSEIENGIKELGETRNLLSAQFIILMEMKRFEEALETALKKENLSQKKSPWDSFDIVRAYLKLNNGDKAIEWLEESAKRGFVELEELEDEAFNLIRNNPKFQKIFKEIKENLGIGKPAKDFTVETISGKKFTLSEQKEKVILVQFWASWCRPCRAEIPNVKNCYEQFKNKGFDVIGISLDRNKEDMMEYMESIGIDWNIAFSGKVWEDETAKLYGVNAIPSFWLVDRKGNLRYINIRGEALKKAISELVAEK